MSGPTIGRAEIKVDFDGDALAAQAQRIGKQAGQGAGSAYNQEFQSKLSKSAKALGDRWARDGTFNGRIYGKNLSTAMGDSLIKSLSRVRTQIADAFTSKDGFESFVKNVGGTKEALLQLEQVLQREHALGEISQKQYKQLGTQANTWAKSIDQADASLININMDKVKAIKANKDLAAAEKLAVEVVRDHDRALKMVADSGSREKIKAATEGMNEQNVRLSASLRDLNAALGNKKSFDSFVRSSGDADSATSKLSASMDDLRRNGRLTTFQTQLLHERMEGLAVTTDKATTSMDRHTKSTKSAGEAHQSLWKGLSANTRQWTLIIAAIAAASQEIAVLGSAAGSSLAVLGTALTAVGAAAIIGIAGFKGMGGDLEDIEEAARPAAIALREMGEVMGELQNGIQSALFKDLAGPFTELTAALPALSDGLNVVAASVGGFLGALASGLASENGISKMSTLLNGFAPIIDGLGQALISLGSAFGTIFIAALPATQLFATWMSTIMEQFNAFLASAEGQTALAAFFDHLIEVMPALGDLIAATGRMLAGLVTEDSVDKLVVFLDNLSAFMPMLGTLLGILGELDIFGLISELLLAFGEALKPLAGPLFELAGVLSGLLSTAMAALVEPIQTVMAAFAPLLPLIGELAGVLLTALVPLLQPLAEMLATVGAALIDILGVAFAAILPLIQPLVDILIALMPSITDLALIVVELLGTALITLAPLLEPIVELFGIVAGIIPPLMPLVAALAEVIGAVLAIAVDVLLALLPPLIDLFVSVWSVVEPLIPIITLLIQSAIVPLQTAFAILTPIIQFAIEVVAAIVDGFVQMAQPLLDLIAPMLDAVGGLDGLGKAADKAKGIISDWGDSIGGVLDGVIGGIKSVIGWFTSLFGASDKASKVSPGKGGGGVGAPPTAIGGIFRRAETRLIGEDGPEAVVPLNRPLSKVDPAVRALSAFAQGKGGQATTTAGRQVTVAAGAIVIQTAANPFLTANAVLDRLVAAAR